MACGTMQLRLFKLGTVLTYAFDFVNVNAACWHDLMIMNLQNAAHSSNEKCMVHVLRMRSQLTRRIRRHKLWQSL